MGRPGRATATLALLGGLALPGCTDASGCIRTTTEATEASRVDLRAATGSATLEASLTERRTTEPLAGKTLRFTVLDDGAAVHTVEGSTGDDGVARVDLKRVDVGALEGLARGDAFRAAFGGDATHCSSAGEAPLTVVAGAPGLPLGGP